MKQATKLIHAGEGVDTGATPSLTTPIYETSTFVFDSAADVEQYQEGKLNGYLYSRYENPTVVAVEQKLAAVDGAESSLLFSSGMAAISTALITLLKAGDEIVCCSAIYGGTFHIIEDLLPKLGIAHRFVPIEALADLVVGDRPADEDRLVRVADQPDAALRRRAHASRPRARRPACCRRSTTPLPARSISRCCRWASTCRCRAAPSTSTATATSPAACCPDRRR